MGIKKLWVARDSWDDLYLYEDKPFPHVNDEGKITYHSYDKYWMLSKELLPEVTPYKGPVEVELKIKDNEIRRNF